ncbi:hypothetical protein CHGG_10524 [Chaetomium globosum CBS 148.51]|uniref:ABC transporter domain-containing protein n=1 Tax=Chaetomium globosum (strain ATCC 6205 / CBS 148.51 / DSM 1962 / NBRC 6347 / NRRL 1970) TaxID=306901 RepID=Q2GND0_CHAGB|nr:uncharacterized protein CHGG_10524 [Chaetomium globosum CBS 148.51]EAQ84120.1 hypothetical protein CHGG_10524 [Chaetomium globosum CBS 148.51]
MAWSAEADAPRHTPFDASASETDVEVNHAFPGEEHPKDNAFQKRLTLTFNNVTVNVTAPGEALGDTLLSWVNPSQLLDVFRKKEHTKRLLVLGRPGAGCTSLLRVLSNDRKSFDEVEGEVWYGNMNCQRARQYRQQITFNTEDDVHFPALTVNQTIKFALRNKVPREREEHLEEKQQYVRQTKNSILGSLGIGHTVKTKVGNEFIRGVSGGERKRVSLAEMMAGHGAMQFWDQPTRGLDSRTALEFAATLRAQADQNGRTIVATMYQAGNGIYNQFDKVLVLADGCVIYYGPTSTAQRYFESLGFVCPKGANVADFLTSITVTTERVIAPGAQGKVPTTPQEFERAYQQSSMCRQMRKSEQPVETLAAEAVNLEEAVQKEKKVRRVNGKRSPYTVGLRDQIINCTIRYNTPASTIPPSPKTNHQPSPTRQTQIIFSDRLSLAIKLISATIQALVCGSLFYHLPTTSTSLFLRPGALFFPVLYFLMEAMSETTASFTGRPILARHKRFGFYRPLAFCVATALTDVPVVLLQVSVFSLVLYFMAALQMDAAKFFTFWVVVCANNLAFLQLFRAVGALCRRFGMASQLTGLLSTVFFVYGGYLIPFRSMHPWFRWIFYLNPGAYAFEALMANEFAGLQLECVAPQYVPFGPGYDGDGLQGHRGCTVLGSDNATGMIDGYAYISQQYSYATGHIWRGFGVLIGFWIAFIAVTALAFELRTGEGGSSVLLYKRGLRNKKKAEQDVEAVTVTQRGEGKSGTSLVTASPPRPVRQSTFCWHNLDYFVKYQGQQKQLLDKVFGYVQPGNLVALMGCSGAGKTTLLDVLAQRKDFGEIHGSILIDGKPQGVSFQRMTGYCEQMDVHEGTSTVKEALVFSALLRQPPGVPKAEKLAYVEHIIDLLDLHDISDALIGAVLFEAFDALLLLAKGGRMTYFGETGKNSVKVLDYFARHGARCPQDTNPADHIVEIIQGEGEAKIDWVDAWNQSPERQQELEKLMSLTQKDATTVDHEKEDNAEFASPKWFQFKMVLYRLMVQLWRSPDYVWNKINLHIFAALFSGFTFWKIGDGSFDLQLRVFAVFNFIFVAPGCINQMQPFFLHNRDLFETREKKIVSEIPYLILCATLYFCCWYFTSGFPVDARVSGHIYLQMICQAIAAYAPNEYFAAISNPLLLGCGLVSFCGVVVPYTAMPAFWKYWLYYLDPFRYLVGGLLGTLLWEVQVKCKPDEFTSFNPPTGQTCGVYMADFLASNAGYVENANSTTSCQYCPYATGGEYAQVFNLNEKYYAWRDNT